MAAFVPKVSAIGQKWSLGIDLFQPIAFGAFFKRESRLDWVLSCVELSTCERFALDGLIAGVSSDAVMRRCVLRSLSAVPTVDLRLFVVSCLRPVLSAAAL